LESSLVEFSILLKILEGNLYRENLTTWFCLYQYKNTILSLCRQAICSITVLNYCIYHIFVQTKLTVFNGYSNLFTLVTKPRLIDP